MRADDGGHTRRGLATSMGVLAGALAGCLEQFQWAIERDEPEQIDVNILTVPDDEEHAPIRIANHLRDNMEAVGMSVDVVPTRAQSMLQDVLFNKDFEMYVWRHPGQVEVDFLRPFFHSRFIEESGWQNPISYGNPAADEYLDAQLREPWNREAHIADFLELFLSEMPIIPVAFESDHHLLRQGVSEAPEEMDFSHPMWVLQAAPSGNDTDEDTLKLGTTNRRMTLNLNPLSVDFRGAEQITELLYDPLVRFIDGEALPWLAEELSWETPEPARAPRIEVTLRPDSRWHDGTLLTAADAVFTYQFYQNTTMSEGDPQIPAPRYRGRSSLVDSIEAVGSRTFEIQFIECSQEVARWALSLPLLPGHVWNERTDLAEIAGMRLAERTTTAVIDANLEPVGSGPYQLTEAESERYLELAAFEDHFLTGIDEAEPASRFAGLPRSNRLRIELRPSVRNIAESIASGELDGSIRSLGREITEEFATSESLVGRAQSTSRLIHVGFNCRIPPFANYGFRHAVSQLLDRRFLLSEVFKDDARAAITPVYDRQFVPDEFEWPSEEFGEFAGRSGTGEISEELAREAFRQAGYQYSEEGELLAFE